jgi:hypothetical protein
VPRLSNQLYYTRHCFLKRAWFDFPELYELLTPSAQWDLHAFYQPSKEYTKADLISHRRVITQAQPSLPARASKSFGVMYQAFRYAFRYANGDELKFRQAVQAFARPGSHTTHTYQAGHRERTIRISSLVHPEPDLKKLAKALAILAREQGI